MKSDLDRLMAERKLDALMTLPTEHENPVRAYLANGAHFSGLVIKKRGEPPVLLAHSMERDEAAKSGLRVYTWDDFGYSALYQQYPDEPDKATVLWYRRVFEALGVRGRVNICGVGDLNTGYRTLRALSVNMVGQVVFVTETARDTIFDRAYETKDAAEIAALRDVAARSSAVMRATRDWLAEHRADADGIVRAADGAPLTVGAVKRWVRVALLEQGLEDPEGMIFAQGRDAGVPHSSGQDDQALRVGESIVFDLFPRAPRGYFHDATRTWCLGEAPPDVQAAYDDVMSAYRLAAEMCAPDVSTSAVQRAVCEHFEERGHPTVLGTPGTTDGYVHSLAHGLGLNVHEAPYFPTHGERYRLQAGNVFTLEPGLYYPERGFGVRIEDTVTLNAEGKLETLTDVPYDLVIPLRG